MLGPDRMNLISASYMYHKENNGHRCVGWSCLPTPDGDSYLDGPGEGFFTLGENPGCKTSPIFSRSQVPMEKPGEVGRMEITCLPMDDGDRYVPGPIFMVVAEVVS